MGACAAAARPRWTRKHLTSLTNETKIERLECGCWDAQAPAPDELPPFFREILTELDRHEHEFGGVKHFSGRPQIEKKVKARDFRSAYSDFEYIYLTVLGFAQLHMHCEEIVRRNNGKVYRQNHGVQLLEKLTGMTMHADRGEVNHLLRSAPACLVEAFAVAKHDRGGYRKFFRDAFDRTADPCLEGRVRRIMEYLGAKSSTSGSVQTPPWEDVSLQPLAPDASVEAVVGEHLRVFVNECTWCWCHERSLTYEDAKLQRQSDKNAADFARLYNAATFESAMLARGVAVDEASRQWEVLLDGGEWSAYDEGANSILERERLRGVLQCEVVHGCWVYDVDLAHMVQHNRATGAERPIRCSDVPAGKKGRVTHTDLKAAIEYFVRLETLPPAPSEAAEQGADTSTPNSG